MNKRKGKSPETDKDGGVSSLEPISSVSKLAHEIKNPLNALLGYTSLMSRSSDEALNAAQVKEWSEVLHQATISLLNTCERVLDDEVSGQSNLDIQNVDFHQLGSRLVSVFAKEAETKGVKLSVEVPDSFPILKTDPVLLTEMLNNLISNSLKFTPKGGSVVVRGEYDPDHRAMVLVVQDDGKGIPGHVLMAIQRGEQISFVENKSNRKGWGIGARVVFENARKLGVKFELFCPEEGGTIAYLKFPE